MQRRILVLVVSSAVFLFAGLFLAAQTVEERGWNRIVPDRLPHGVAPDGLPPSAVWKHVNDDLGLLITRDAWGARRATLYVRVDDRWESVALDGPAELLPRILPAAR